MSIRISILACLLVCCGLLTGAEESNISFDVIEVDCTEVQNPDLSVLRSDANQATETATAIVIVEVGNIPPENFDINDYTERIKTEAIEAVWGNIADVRWVVKTTTITGMEWVQKPGRSFDAEGNETIVYGIMHVTVEVVFEKI